MGWPPLLSRLLCTTVASLAGSMTAALVLEMRSTYLRGDDCDESYLLKLTNLKLNYTELVY